MADDTPEALPDWGEAFEAMKEFPQTFKTTSRLGLFKRDPEPEMNSFLLNLCARSVMKCTDAADQEAGGVADDDQTTPSADP